MTALLGTVTVTEICRWLRYGYIYL